MLAEQIEVVIGVDTQRTHTAAVVAAATGAFLAQLTVVTDPAGYRSSWSSPGSTARCGRGR